jgi:hypothetical protein
MRTLFFKQNFNILIYCTLASQKKGCVPFLHLLALRIKSAGLRMLNGRLAVTRLQACGFKRQACRLEKPVSKLKIAGFRHIFLHFSTS